MTLLPDVLISDYHPHIGASMEQTVKYIQLACSHTSIEMTSCDADITFNNFVIERLRLQVVKREL